MTIAKGRYVSFNADELQRLACADYDAIALYFALKQKVNFKTGAFGTFKNQAIPYSELAIELYRPMSARQPECAYNDAGIIDLLDHLERLSLIEDRQYLNGRLTMILPHSRKWPQKASEPAAPAASDASTQATPEKPTPAKKPAATEIEKLAAAEKLARELEEFDLMMRTPTPPPTALSSSFPSVMIITDSSDVTDLKVTTADDKKEQHPAEALDALLAAGEAQANTPIRMDGIATLEKPTLTANPDPENATACWLVLPEGFGDEDYDSEKGNKNGGGAANGGDLSHGGRISPPKSQQPQAGAHKA